MVVRIRNPGQHVLFAQGKEAWKSWIPVCSTLVVLKP